MAYGLFAFLLTTFFEIAVYYMINAISAADIAFISSTSAWLLSPWSVLLRNKMAERFASVSEDELCEKMSNKTIIEFGFRMISLIIKTSVLIIHDIMLNLIQ